MLIQNLRMDESCLGKRSNKCNQCDFASSRADVLRRHLTTHSEEKSNKCNQCDFASSQAGYLRRHSKTHSREKLNKCNQCDKASSDASFHFCVKLTDLKKHNNDNATNLIMYPSEHAIHLVGKKLCKYTCGCYA